MNRPFETRAIRSLTICLLLGATAGASAQKTVVFGAYTADKPATVLKEFSPVMAPLGEALSTKLGEPVEVKLRVFLTYDAAVTALVEGKVDMARFGPASYVLAKSRDAGIEALAMESKNGKRTFSGLIVVRQESPIENIEGLHGQSFAFGDRNSTVGRYLAQELLLKAGISARELSEYSFLDRHDRVFLSVQKKLYVAGAIKSSTFKKLNQRNQLRVLTEFSVPTKPWVIRSGLSEELSAALRATLLGWDDAAALESLKVTGFLPTSDKEYDGVRASMQAARRFDTPATPGK